MIDLVLKNILKHQYFIIILILLFGLFVRFVLIINIEEPIDKDAEEYYKIATNIVDGKGFTIDGENPTLRRSPGYPFLLATIIYIFGNNPNFIYIFQAFINILTIFIIFLSLKQFNINPIINIITILLFTTSTSFVYTNLLYATIPTLFFIALLTYLNIKMKRSFVKSSISGIIIGILIFLRPTFLYLPIFILLSIPFFFIKNLKKHIPDLLLISTIAILTILPWTIRNKIAFQKWVPLVAAGGQELWQANVEIPDRFVWYSVTNINKYENQRSESFILQKELISKYKASDHLLNNQNNLNNYLSVKAKENIKSHPIRFLVLCFNRFLIFWFSPMIGATKIKSLSIIIYWFLLLIKYLLTIFSIIGFILLGIKHFEKFFIIILLILYLTILHSAVHSIQRYFLPLLPLCYFSLGYFFNKYFINIIKKYE